MSECELSSSFKTFVISPVRAPRQRISLGACIDRNCVTSGTVISSTTQKSFTPTILFPHIRPNFSASPPESLKHFVNDSFIWWPRNASIKAGTSSVVLSNIFCAISPTAIICMAGFVTFTYSSSSENSCSMSWYSSIIKTSYALMLASIDKGTRGSAGRKCPHTASKPLRIHKVFSAAFSLSASISAPAELLRIGQP